MPTADRRADLMLERVRYLSQLRQLRTDLATLDRQRADLTDRIEDAMGAVESIDMDLAALDLREAEWREDCAAEERAVARCLGRSYA